MSPRRKILLVAGIVLAIVILIPIARHYEWRWRLASLQAQLRAKGLPMDLAQMRPPKLSPEENGADAFLQADEALKKVSRGKNNFFDANLVGGMIAVAPGRAMIRSQQPYFRDSDGTFSWEQIAAAVSANNKSIIPLQQLIDKPNFDFGFDYGKGFDELYVVQSKRAAQRLLVAAMVDLHDGDMTSAVKNIRAMLALAKAMSSERLWISELVSMAIASMAYSATWEALQSPNVTDEQLVALQKDWASMDFIHGETDAAAMELVMNEKTADDWRDSNEKFQQYMHADDQFSRVRHRETFFEKSGVNFIMFIWRYWWSYPDEMQMLKGYEIMNETARSLETNYCFQDAITMQNKKINALFDLQKNGLRKTVPKMHEVFSENVPGLAAAISRAELFEANKQVVVTALALKRYQIKHGSYPVNLDVLVPEFLASVPLDPVDGQPLRYKLKPDGDFVLYSVGENGVDDGGDPSLEAGVQSSNYYWQNFHALDWVWPQPATQEEIQSYYQKLAKK